jgi:hypothetical protein
MQLVAYGAQDIYLTGNPQITFFKVVYRRHTNFSMETIQQTINGTSTTTTTKTTGTVTISRNGDLVYKVYVHVPAVDGNEITNGISIVDEVELEIGGQKIDKHTLEWNEIYAELFISNNKGMAFRAMTGTHHTHGRGLHIPLNFWFCRNPGLALPLIALQYHEVKLKFTWGKIIDMQFNAGVTKAAGKNTATNPEVWCDYIYLDTDERRRFAQVSHEYLIEQIQYQDLKAAAETKLNFNHPVKELIWTGNAQDGLQTKLQLNGHDRLAFQDQTYYQLRQPYEYHSAVPPNNLSLGADYDGEVLLDGVASFAVKATPGDVTTSGDICFTKATGTSANHNLYSKPSAHLINPAEKGHAGDAAIVTSAIDASDAVAYMFISFERSQLSLDAANGMRGKKYLIKLASGLSAKSFTFVVPSTFQALNFDRSGRNKGHSTSTQTHGVQGLSGNAQTTIVGAVLGRGTALHAGIGVAVEAAAEADVVEVLLMTGAEAVSNLVHHHQGGKTRITNQINVYSFALKPEEHQPSGTCNFSRIDNAKLVHNVTTGGGSTIYAVNYNVLRIMSGMGGLAYSN